MQKIIWGLALLLFALPAFAGTVDYTETVVNAPGGIGDFSWTVETNGFIQPPPAPMYDSQGHCLNCDANLFTPTDSSAPSLGGGCQITGVWLWPNFGPAPVTEFSPKCDGLYDSFSGGVLPDVGTLGTWDWQWTNPDGSENFITLSITDTTASSDPPRVPEPGTLALLAIGLLSLFLPVKLRTSRNGVAGITL